MQTSPNDLNDDDRRVHRRWSVAFGLVYGTIALTFVAVVALHPPITTEIVTKIEGIKSAEATGSIPSVSKKVANK
jgi:hypothetical protein